MTHLDTTDEGSEDERIDPVDPVDQSGPAEPTVPAGPAESADPAGPADAVPGVASVTRRRSLQALCVGAAGILATSVATATATTENPDREDDTAADGRASDDGSAEPTPLLTPEPCADAAGVETVGQFHTVCDLDGDGNYRDVTGDARVTNSDVTEFFGNQHASPWNDRADLFDFDGDDEVGQGDVLALFYSVV